MPDNNTVDAVPEKKRPTKSMLKGMASVGLPVGIGSQAGAGLLGLHLFENLHNKNWGPIEANPRELARKLLQEGGRSPSDIRKFTMSTDMHRAGPHYRPSVFGSKEHLQLPKSLASPMVVSHEVGHAAATNPFSKLLRAARVAPGLGLLGPGLLIGGTLASDPGAEEMNLAQKAALPVSVARALAVQGEELRASLLGRHLLKRLGRSTPHFWKQLLSTQGTYALGNLASVAPIVGGTIAIKKLMEKRREANKKTAAELADQILSRV